MWLINEETANKIRAAVAAGARITEAQSEQWAREQTQALHDGTPRPLTLAGDVAEIRVVGVLTEKPDFFMRFFGGGNTSYEDIRASLAIAQQDPAIRRVEVVMDSPGGQIHGLFETMDAINAFTKPKRVTARSALSAAYALAATFGKITATNVAAEFGSIGILNTQFIDPNVVHTASTHAPNKAPDASTDEGKAVIQKRLDSIHQLFAEYIAGGRGTSVDTVNTEFGRGAILVAKDAKRLGMIDAITKPQLRAVPGATAPSAPGASATPEPTEATPPAAAAAPSTPLAEADHQPEEQNIMDLAELNAKHPDLVTALKAEGAKAALETERDRVQAHLKMGASSGAMDVAVKAVMDGTSMTQSLQADYMAAGMNKSAQANAQADAKAAADATAGAPTTVDPPPEAGTPEAKDAAIAAAYKRQSSGDENDDEPTRVAKATGPQRLDDDPAPAAAPAS